MIHSKQLLIMASYTSTLVLHVPTVVIQEDNKCDSCAFVQIMILIMIILLVLFHLLVVVYHGIGFRLTLN